MDSSVILKKSLLFSIIMSLPVFSAAAAVEAPIKSELLLQIEEPTPPEGEPTPPEGEPTPPEGEPTPPEGEFYVPVEDGKYRAAKNLSVFFSDTADKYRMPSMVDVGNGEVLFFSEKRNKDVAVSDFKEQDIIMRRLNRESGVLDQKQYIIKAADSYDPVPINQNSVKANLMNPTTVFDTSTNTVHLFYNRVLSNSSNDAENVYLHHMTSNDRGQTWSNNVVIPQASGSCETTFISAGSATLITDGMYRGRLVLPQHTAPVEVAKKNHCNSSELVPAGIFHPLLSDDGGKTWTRSYASLTTGSNEGKIGEVQTLYLNGTIYMMSRLRDDGDYGYDGTGIGYSRDGGNTWFRGFYPNSPYKDGERIGLTGRFVTPTQSGMATDGENIYYATSVHWVAGEEGITVRKEGWIHKFNPNDMLTETDSPIIDVQPITKSGFSNVATTYLGNNQIGMLWEEVRTDQPIKRIYEIFYTELDTRDFRKILDPSWVGNGFNYHPTKNGSHHLLNPEINEGDKSDQWNPQ